MEPRIPELSEWPSLQQFLKDTLRPEHPWSLSEEFPTAIAKDRLNNLRIIAERNKILSHAACRTSLIKTPLHFFKVGVIGSVCTAPQARGKGLAASAVNSVLTEAIRQQCELAILWTDKNGFYEKLGFTDGGQEVLLQLPQTPLPLEKEWQHCDDVILEGNNVAPINLLNLFNKHLLRSIRTTADIQKLLKIPNSKLWTAWTPGKTQLKAYAVVGKGADFKNFAHEWGGSVSSLVGLLNHINESSENTLHLISPPDCKNLIKTLVDGGSQRRHNPLGMIKILDPHRFCQKINKGARALGVSQFQMQFHEGSYHFKVAEDSYATDLEADIVRLVFGPQKPSDLFSFSSTALEVLNEIFPIPFWIWGWDSI